MAGGVDNGALNSHFSNETKNGKFIKKEEHNCLSNAMLLTSSPFRDKTQKRSCC